MEITKAIDRVRHLAKVYAAQALKPVHAQRPATPEDALNAEALAMVAYLAHVGAEAVHGEAWRNAMCKGYLGLAASLVVRQVDFGGHSDENSATLAAVAEIDRLRAEVTRLKSGILAAQIALRDNPDAGSDVVWFSTIETLWEHLETLRDPDEQDPCPIESQHWPAVSPLRAVSSEDWEPCSPAWLTAHPEPHACANAPRVYCRAEGNHYHPKTINQKG